MASGDPHYRTFDGQMIHFMGECKYTLSKLDSTDECAFNVEVKNVKRHENSKVSFTRLVDVKVPGYNIRLLQKKRLTVRFSKSKIFSCYETNIAFEKLLIQRILTD